MIASLVTPFPISKSSTVISDTFVNIIAILLSSLFLHFVNNFAEIICFQFIDLAIFLRENNNSYHIIGLLTSTRAQSMSSCKNVFIHSSFRL